LSINNNENKTIPFWCHKNKLGINNNAIFYQTLLLAVVYIASNLHWQLIDWWRLVISKVALSDQMFAGYVYRSHFWGKFAGYQAVTVNAFHGWSREIDQKDDNANKHTTIIFTTF